MLIQLGLMKNFQTLLIILFSFTAGAQTVNVNSTQVCFGMMTQLVGSSTIADSSIIAWNWDLDNNGLYNDASGKTINFIFPQPDTNLVGFKITKQDGSSDSILSKTILVNPLPSVNFHVDNLCESKAAVYSSQSTISRGIISQFLWDFNNDGAVDDNTGSTVSFICGPAQTYVTKLQCVSDKGCSAFATKTTEVYNQPQAGFITQNTCSKDSTVFMNTSTLTNGNIIYYLWNFGDGVQEVNMNNSYHQYNSNGSYDVSLIAVSDHNCRDTAKKSVNIYDPPDFSLSLSGDSVMKAGESVTIEVIGSAVSYLWSTGETTNSISANKNGTYSVKATDINGCSDHLSVGIVVKEPGESVAVYNNLLTPNADGQNDHLIIEDIGIYDHCEISVYDRWNMRIFHSANYENNWDGTSNGTPLDPGTYFYIIHCDGKSLKGSINILK